ncbi:hypothetical protein B0H14DRAFT_3669198 [Mycena olivaceomarginata]|nr:hypothetical protein B0H14DRAFT_3669198 [Mycena olivaceomarginata]
MRAVRRYTTREICLHRLLLVASSYPRIWAHTLWRCPRLRREAGGDEAQFGGGVRYAIAARCAGRPAPIPTPAVPRLAPPPPRTPAPLPADLGELDLLAPVLCAFPLELELELELGCAESRRSNPASADGRLGRLPGIFGRLGVNFDVEFAPGAAPTLAACCSPAPALARKMEIPALEAPVPCFECAVLNADALLDADGEAEENDAPTALRSAAAASGAQSRVPTVTLSSAGSSLARRGSSRSAWGWWRGYGCWYLFSVAKDPKYVA